ncbi:flagellar motor protein MotB [Sphaerotilus sp.]|uniref:OmpA/MotB family protein n=1 Tax=Sphaerotilus sp. TaxID=2093942 RepID=UPI00286EABA8|nr:flagellar motor protein MotB [Sphaerotilus sp.]
MFGPKFVIKRGARDEAEKPFWISFADLMTALMVLFLVVMAVALLAVTKAIDEPEKKHGEKIKRFLEGLSQAAEKHDGIKVDINRQVINFGEKARFSFAKSNLSVEQEIVLRKFIPEVLVLANEPLGLQVLKRVVVEGYTDKTGSYLSNLNLSLQRSQRVLCAMFSTAGPYLLTDVQKEEVRALFLVGGYSFNAAKETDEESRRVEVRLEFLKHGESRPPAPHAVGNFGNCALT